MKEETYKNALKYIYSLQKFGIKFGLSKTENILKTFGNPHYNKKYIHIAGTNGKGSVASFISSVLKESGYKVGLYTSPHLVRFTERIKINGIEISQKDAANLIFELKKIFIPEEPPTFFEAVTAMAIIYFCRQKTDIDIMEVGMGGRLDATNVINPIISIITNISLEHQQFLGSRLIDIAKEKAGIIKEKVDLITGVTQSHIIRFFEYKAKEMNVSMFRIGKHIRYKKVANKINYYGIKEVFRGIEPGINGIFQARNVATAIGTLELLKEKGFFIPREAIYKGIKNTFWPGRMHILSKSPYIILDGAHNPYAIKMLVKSIKERFKKYRLILVIGIMKDKDIKAMLGNILPLSDYVIYTRPAYSRAATPETLADLGKVFNKPTEIIPILKNAIDKALNLANKNSIILITGSLFTVGEALSYLDPIKYRPDEITE